MKLILLITISIYAQLAKHSDAVSIFKSRTKREEEFYEDLPGFIGAEESLLPDDQYGIRFGAFLYYWPDERSYVVMDQHGNVVGRNFDNEKNKLLIGRLRDLRDNLYVNGLLIYSNKVPDNRVHLSNHHTLSVWKYRKTMKIEKFPRYYDEQELLAMFERRKARQEKADRRRRSGSIFVKPSIKKVANELRIDPVDKFLWKYRGFNEVEEKLLNDINTVSDTHTIFDNFYVYRRVKMSWYVIIDRDGHFLARDCTVPKIKLKMGKWLWKKTVAKVGRLQNPTDNVFLNAELFCVNVTMGAEYNPEAHTTSIYKVRSHFEVEYYDPCERHKLRLRKGDKIRVDEKDIRKKGPSSTAHFSTSLRQEKSIKESRYTEDGQPIKKLTFRENPVSQNPVSSRPLKSCLKNSNRVPSKTSQGNQYEQLYGNYEQPYGTNEQLYGNYEQPYGTNEQLYGNYDPGATQQHYQEGNVENKENLYPTSHHAGSSHRTKNGAGSAGDAGFLRQSTGSSGQAYKVNYSHRTSSAGSGNNAGSSHRTRNGGGSGNNAGSSHRTKSGGGSAGYAGFPFPTGSSGQAYKANSHRTSTGNYAGVPFPTGSSGQAYKANSHRTSSGNYAGSSRPRSTSQEKGKGILLG